jgi:hypothetical protein
MFVGMRATAFFACSDTHTSHMPLKHAQMRSNIAKFFCSITNKDYEGCSRAIPHGRSFLQLELDP